MRLLLERKDVSPNRPNKYGQTLLSWAARNGCEEVVKLLLEREDVSPDKPDNDGRTPLSWAALYGREGVVKLLLEREDISPVGQTIIAEHRSRGPSGMGVKE